MRLKQIITVTIVIKLINKFSKFTPDAKNMVHFLKYLIEMDSSSKNLLEICSKCKKNTVNKVDVQNNILHTLREASYVGKKAIF